MNPHSLIRIRIHIEVSEDKIFKNFVEKNHFISKYLSIILHEDFKATGEASRPTKRAFSTSKSEISSLVPFFGSFFAFDGEIPVCYEEKWGKQ